MNTRKRRGGPAARLGAVLLSLVMIFTLIPGVSFPVLAEEASGTPESMEAPAETPGETPGEEASVTPEAIETPTDEASTKMLSQEASVGILGTTDEGLGYEENSDGGITITDYDGDGGEVVIPAEIEGKPVTAIDDGVFSGCDDITSVTIPANVTYIGPNAFAYCYSLKIVTFLGKAPEVDYCAFDFAGEDVGGTVFHCHLAYTADFESALDEWLESYGCTIKTFGELSSISIKTKPSKLQYTPGQNLELTGMTVEATYTGELIDGNVIVTISSGFTSDPANGTPLNSLGTQTVTVTYPKTDTPKKTATFDVTVEEGEPEATPDAAFTFVEAAGSCTVSSFNGGYENVVVPKTYNGKSVTAIGDEAFSGCTALKSVVLPDSVTAIGKEAFYNCTAMDTLNLGKGVKTIGQMAFQYCKALTTVNLPASVEDIGYSAFAYCKKLTDIKVDAGNSTFKDIDGVLFSKDGKILLYYSVAGRPAETYAVPEGTVRIEEDAFRTNYEDTLTSALESVSYPSTLKEIGDRAFWQTSLKEITIYPGITMGDHVYELCKNLKTVHVAEGVTELSKNLFYGLDNLETLTLPSTLKKIDESALERYPLASIQLPEGLEEIGNDAFANAKLTSLTIPASVTTLGDRAFYINSELKTLNFAEGSKLETINQYAFTGCKALESVTLPAGLKDMGTGAFSNCYSLTGISLPDGLTALGNSVFAYTGIKTITFPDRMTSIGSYAFYCCTALNGISFPDSITTIGEGAFGGCTALTGITLPKVLEELGAYAFEYCEHLASVEFPETIKIKTLPAGTFVDCLGLRELHLPAAITRTEDAVFLNCAALKVKYDIPRLLRSPLDLHNFILGDDSLYDLGEDGFYYTNVDLQFGDETVRAGYKLEPQKNGVVFVYNGKEENRIQPAIKSVGVTKVAGSGASDAGALVEIIAEGIQAGDKVQIKAVHKTTGHTVTGEGIVALGKAENRGYFVALKTLILDVGALEDYNISASLDGKTWVDGSGKPVQLDYIRVTSSPQKASYTVGDKLDLTGLAVKASYTDKSSKNLDGSAYTTTPAGGSELNTVGKQTVIVKYTENGIEKTASFDVTVNAKDTGDGNGGNGSGSGSKGGGGSKTPVTDNNTTTGGAVSIPVTNPVTTNSNHFEDMPSAPWAAEAVNFVTSRGLFTGTSANHFEPDGTMTRAMVMTVLFRIEGGTASENAPSWYSDALNWSKEKGFSDGSNPNGYITREQLAAILYRHAGSPATAGSLNSFSDRDQVSTWAADALSWAVEKGLITGKGNGVLDPGGNATRAEVAAIIMRYLNK